MSAKYRFSALYYDGVEFLRRNMGRFVSFLIFAFLGILIGIWYGVVVSGNTIFLWSFQTNIILVAVGQMSFFKYLFWLLIECVLIVGIIICLSLHYYLTFFSYLVFIYKGYLLAFNTVVLIAAAKLSCIPFILLCYLPLSLVILFFLSCFSLKLSLDSAYAFSTNCPLPFRQTLRSTAPILIIMVITCFIQSILTFILCSGIVI